MSTQKSKPSSSEDDAHSASGQRPALRYPSEPNLSENQQEGAGFSATCENTSLFDWIQLVQMNRRDAVIGIKRHDGKKALLWCRDGDIIDAWCDGVIGEDAAYRALTWEGGQVSVTFASFEHERQIEIATPALLLRAAYRKDSGVHELRPEGRAPSSPAPVPSVPSSAQAPLVVPDSKRPSIPAPPLVARSALPPLARPVKTMAFSPPHGSLEATASSPAAANLALKASVPALAPPTEPVAATPQRRRIRKLAWLLGIALGVLLLLGLTASWRVTPNRDVALPAPPRKISTHADPSRAEVTPSVPAAANLGREDGLVPHSATTAVPRPRAAASVPRGASPPRPAAAASLKAPLPTLTKPENKTTPDPQTVGVRAPRVQIIDERESKIEVIE